MQQRDVRRRCQALLADLATQRPLDVRDLLAGIAERRGRPIRLLAKSVDLGPCGLWARYPDHDVVFYDARTSRLHRRHIILHELAHALCEHASDDGIDSSVLTALAPDVAPETARAMLGRGHYDTSQELEAETLADLMADLLARSATGGRRPGARDPADTSAGAVLDRLSSTLGGSL